MPQSQTPTCTSLAVLQQTSNSDFLHIDFADQSRLTLQVTPRDVFKFVLTFTSPNVCLDKKPAACETLSPCIDIEKACDVALFTLKLLIEHPANDAMRAVPFPYNWALETPLGRCEFLGTDPDLNQSTDQAFDLVLPYLRVAASS